MIQVVFDQASIDRFAGGFVKEIPFAISYASNRTGKNAVADLRSKTVPGKFTLRNQWTQKGIRVTYGNKRNPDVTVGTRDSYLADHEGGTMRKPRSGGRFAIPVAIRENESVRITPTKRPKRLLRGGKFKKATPFIATMKSGKEGIFVRREKGRLPIQLLYHLHREPVKIRDRDFFVRSVAQTLERRMPVNFERALIRAIGRAR